MRPLLLPTLALASTLALPAFASEPSKKKPDAAKVVCAVQSKNGSRVVQNTDLVIEPGEKAKDVVAVDGNLLIRKGAQVEDAVAVHGRVIVESGARVKGDVVSLGGEVEVRDGAHVDGDAVALGGKLKIAREEDVEGDRVDFSLAFNGEDLVKGFLEKALDESTGCNINLDDDDDEDDDDGDSDV